MPGVIIDDWFCNSIMWLPRTVFGARRSGLRARLFGMGLLLIALLSVRVVAQTATGSSCSRDRALELIQQQIDFTKTFDGPTQRIAVLLKAADLLWPRKEERARVTFKEAFEVAKEDFKNHGDALVKEGRALLVETPDQRYVVIQAIAKRDQGWAKKLLTNMLKDDDEEARQSTAKDLQTEERTAGKLLDSAAALLGTNTETAVALATLSLGYPATIRLTPFLYKLAEVNQPLADDFYARALAVYGNKPLREFLYLAAYPFAWTDSGDMPWQGTYAVPRNFVTNRTLQNGFVRTLAQRASLALSEPAQPGDDYNGLPANGHMLQVLARLEASIQDFDLDLVRQLAQTKNNLLASLNPEQQSLFLASNTDSKKTSNASFEEQIEAAEKLADPIKRDDRIITAILNSNSTEPVTHIVDAAAKISDADVRDQVLGWFYFNRAENCVKSNELDEAVRLASKVTELDQRAFLYSEIARESFKHLEDRNRGIELLEQIVTTASKAPANLVTARTLMAVAYLYLSIDQNRAMSILADAVKCINGIDAPDFSKTSQTRKIETRSFARYATYKTPGFNPEALFLEIGRVSFDDALGQAATFTDKKLRAMTTLTLADLCLRSVDQQERKKPKESQKQISLQH